MTEQERQCSPTHQGPQGQKKKKFPQEAQKVTSVMSQEEATHNAKAQMQTTSHACYLKN